MTGISLSRLLVQAPQSFKLPTTPPARRQIGGPKPSSVLYAYIKADMLKERERAEAVGEDFVWMLNDEVGAIREAIFPYLNLRDLSQLSLVCKGLRVVVKDYLFGRSVFYDFALPRDSLGFDDVVDLAQELSCYDAMARLRIEEFSQMEHSEFEALMVHKTVRYLFGYVLFRTERFNAEGQLIDGDRQLLHDIHPFARDFCHELKVNMFYHLLLVENFGATDAPTLRYQAQKIVALSCSIMEAIAKFIQRDQRLDSILGQGRRHDHAKTKEEAHLRVMAMLQILKESEISVIAKARLCCYVLSRAYVAPIRFASHFADASGWLERGLGYNLGNYVASECKKMQAAASTKAEIEQQVVQVV